MQLETWCTGSPFDSTQFSLLTLSHFIDHAHSSWPHLENQTDIWKVWLAGTEGGGEEDPIGHEKLKSFHCNRVRIQNPFKHTLNVQEQYNDI